MLKRLIASHEVFICLFLGITFFGSGMAKLYTDHAYFGWIGPVWLEERLAPHGLGLYARFVAFSQIVIGYLIFTYRFRVLGAVMAIPLIANILMVTVSLQWRGTPQVIAVLLLMDLYLIYRHRHVLSSIIGVAGREVVALSTKYSLIWLTGLLLNLTSIFLSVYSIPLAWGLSLAGLAVSFYTNRMEMKNKNY